MLKISLHNLKGEKIGEEKLNPEIFDIKINDSLVHKYINIYLGNKRKNIASTKGRSDVRGGGRKPWKQKGTGRARAGSIRSPIWKGGGVTFGPSTERNYNRKLNKKEKRQAYFMALSSKQGDKKIILVDEIKFDKIKTKDAVEILNNLKVKNNKVLVVIKKFDDKIAKSFKNIENLNVELASNLNAYNVLRNDFMILAKDSLGSINKLKIS